MIFITVGSQKFQFNRLLKEVDDLIENGKITTEVFAQIGYSDYIPKNYKFEKFLTRCDFIKQIEACELFITHGGSGSIISALKLEKKVIAMPRLAQYQEHVDNHQEEIIDQFKELNLIIGINDVQDLEKHINNIKLRKFERYVSSTTEIIDSIASFINEM